LIVPLSAFALRVSGAAAERQADSFGEPFEAEIPHEAGDPLNLTRVMPA
jgi:hypothetical protein